MSACATSSQGDTKWQGAARAGSLAKLSTENSACCVSNACHDVSRRGRCGEASRRAVLRKSEPTVVATSNAGGFIRMQTCQGKRQEPCSSDGRIAGTKIPEVLKAHRQGLPWGDYESPGRNNSEREVASKVLDPRAEPATVG